MKYSRGSSASLIVLAMFMLGALILLLMRQTIIDQVVVWQYEPTTEIEELASRTEMSTKGRFLFYASKPSISERDEFNKMCSNHDHSTAVLGCYTAGDIYIYDITEPRLDGIKAVTAAHEMLHAAYERLSENEREKINELLNKEYALLQNDEDLAARVAVYEDLEAEHLDNELHSLLGTEVKNLSPELEEYYAKYFDNRSKVVKLYDSYRLVFDELEGKADDINNKLSSLQKDINQRSKAYSDGVARLNRDINDFNRRAGNGSFTSEAAFESERASLMARSSGLASERRIINERINEFNALNAQLLDIANQTKALDQSINSSLPATPQL